jgi:hypothetical protein
MFATFKLGDRMVKHRLIAVSLISSIKIAAGQNRLKATVCALLAAFTVSLALSGCSNSVLEDIPLKNTTSQDDRKRPVDKGIKINPAFIDLGRGVTQPFSAVDSSGNKISATWTLSGASDSGTAIDNEGTLTVALDETAGQLVIKAASTVDTTKFGTAVVSVQGNGSIPIEKGITVKPSVITVKKGARQTFTAAFGATGNEAEGLLWSIEGAKSAATEIDQAGGELTVAEDEYAAFIVVKASISDDIYGTATVFVENFFFAR